MTWRPGIETLHPSGRKRDVFEVSCDAPGCELVEVVGRQGGNRAKVQRLLFEHGWEFVIGDGGRDLCPQHAQPVVPT